MKNFKFTAIIEKGDDGWYVGQIEEVPEAISQGKTIAELKENLIDALQMILDLKREAVNQQFEGRKIIKRKIELA